MKTEREIVCAWCFDALYATGEWPTHHDENDQPLFDQHHHAGRYIDDETSDRIAKDGP